jgi:hypothetical protein
VLEAMEIALSASALAAFIAVVLFWSAFLGGIL